jgi:hypothetical protein
MKLDFKQASSLAKLALAGVVREFPHKPDHVLNGPSDAQTPRELHPAFYGCYDWHSAVHSHWLLVRLLDVSPDLPEASPIKTLLAVHLSAKNLEAELAYVKQPGRLSFERPYGWAWFFKLTEALLASPDMAKESIAVRPLAECFAERLIDWLPRQRYPIRTGVHSNTAFALAFALDYARATNHKTLEKAVTDAALRFYGGDRDAPVAWEPSGNDFFSPALIEADLMRRVLDASAFRDWFLEFIPDVERCELLTPAVVSDRGDAQGVHLDGLNLSRAWCLKGIAAALPEKAVLLHDAAERHLEAALRHVESGDFLGEHWLGTFALYALTC